jgi:Uma2 family endonuclease
MIQAKDRKLTFEEYLNYSDETDNRYEFIDGELITLPPESPINDCIPNYLFLVFVTSQLVVPALIRPHTCEVQVPVINPSYPANCYPDLVILREEHLILATTRMTVTLDMPPPQLVVEVVSPGRVGRERDYDPLRGLRQRKRAQYAARGIPEYWIVDPQEQIVMVLQLDEGQYVEVGVFQGIEALVSPTFPQLSLTAEQILGANF